MIAFVVFQDRIGLQIQLTAAPAEQVRLIDYSHWRANRHLAVNAHNVLRIHAQTTMTAAQADARRFVGAMDGIVWPGEFQYMRPHWIVWSWRYHGRQRITVLRMLFADGRCRYPSGVFLFGGDFGSAFRCFPFYTADTERMGDDLFWLACLALRKIKQSHCCKIDHTAVTRCVR